MKSIVFRFRFHWSFVSNSPTDNKHSIGLDNGLAPKRRQAIIWTNADPIQWHIYAALEGVILLFMFYYHLFDFVIKYTKCIVDW